jgi:hypothetical protein
MVKKNVFIHKGFLGSVNFFACMFFVLAIPCGSLLAGEFIITKDGAPAAVIKIATKASDVDKVAASDLQRYIEEISGAKLEITTDPVTAGKPAILIGQSEEVMALVGKLLSIKQLGSDGYIIKTYCTSKEAVEKDTPNRLVVAGRAVGTRFAVYELLYKLGCRFYAPHDDGECIPKQKTLKISNMSLVSKPEFRLRGIWQSFDSGNSEMVKKDRKAFKNWSLKNGLSRHRTIDMGHNFDTIMPSSKYFKDHPKWFALAKGKSGKLIRGGTAAPAVPGATPGNMQLCLSNPEVQQMFIDAACKRFGTKTGKTFSLSPADTGPERWCQCAKCKAMDGDGGLAQRLTAFGNIVASAVEKKSPGNYFPYYVEYYLPGKVVADDGTVRIRCHKSLTPTFVNTYCPFHSPDDPKCSRSAAMRRAFGDWDKISSQMAVRDYRMWSLIIPNPATWSIGQRIQFFRNAGAKWYSVEVIGRSPDSDLALYVTARILWDADRDPDAIVDEFFVRYFGEVSKEMKNYYKYLNFIFLKQHNNSCTKYAKALGRKEIMELRRRLAPAFAKAKTPIVKRRVEREKIALDIYSAMVDVWIGYKKWKINKVQTQQVALEIKKSIEKMDTLLLKADGKMIVSEKVDSNWWKMLKDGIFKAIASKLPAAKNTKVTCKPACKGTIISK